MSKWSVRLEEKKLEKKKDIKCVLNKLIFLRKIKRKSYCIIKILICFYLSSTFFWGEDCLLSFFSSFIHKRSSPWTFFSLFLSRYGLLLFLNAIKNVFASLSHESFFICTSFKLKKHNVWLLFLMSPNVTTTVVSR